MLVKLHLLLFLCLLLIIIPCTGSEYPVIQGVTLCYKIEQSSMRFTSGSVSPPSTENSANPP